MKITKHIPNMITSLNLLCGVLGVIFVMEGKTSIAFPLMLAAAFFDFFDGLAARLFKASSDMGRELDSLSDLVSFGVLPSLMLVNLMKVCTYSMNWICYIPVVLAVFSGVRLAKFNIDERQHSSFIGLPTPAAAMVCGSLCYFEAVQPGTFISVWAAGKFFVPALSIVLSVLLVSEIPMFSVKFAAGEADHFTKGKRISFLVNVILCAVIVIFLGLNWSLVILLTFLMYILMNLVYAFFPARK